MDDMVQRLVRRAGERVADRHQRGRLPAGLVILADGELVQQEIVERVVLQRFAQLRLGLGVAALLEQEAGVVL